MHSVIVYASAQVRRRKSRAEFYSLYCSYRKHCFCKFRVKLVEYWFSKSCRNAFYYAFNYSACAVAVPPEFIDFLLHKSRRLIVRRTQGVLFYFQKVDFIAFYSGGFKRVRRRLYVFLFKYHSCNGAGCNAGSSFPAGSTSSAAVVAYAVFFAVRKVRVSGAESFCKI